MTSIDETPPGPESPSRQAASYVTWAAVAAVSAAGLILSGGQLVDVAQSGGWTGWTKFLLPLVLDGSAIAGGLVQRYGRSDSARKYGALVLIESAILSIAGNLVAHLVGLNSPLPTSVNAALSVAIPVQVVLTVHMGMSLVDSEGRVSTADKSEADKGEEQVETRTDQVSSSAAAVSSSVERPGNTGGVPSTDHRPDRGADLPTTQPMPRVVRSEDDAPRGAESPKSAPRGRSGVIAPASKGETHSGDIKASMREVWDRHVAAGTTDTLTGSKLAVEAGCGSRQVANNYLKGWKQEVAGEVTRPAGVSSLDDKRPARVSSSTATG